MKNSWKTLLSVLLLLAMLVSMLPFAAFAEDDQTTAAQTEEAAAADDALKVEEKTGDTPKADGKTDATKTDEKSGDTVKDAEKAEDKGGDTSKDDAAKDESKDDAANDESKDNTKEASDGDTEQPAKGSSEYAAQAETLQAQNEPKPLTNPSATLIYNANGGTGADYVSEKSGDRGAAEVFFKAEKIERFTPPENKEFGSWNTSADGKGTTYNVGNLVIVRGGESLTLYAQWVDAAPKTVDITLTYDANGGTGSSSETKTFNVGEPYTFTVKSRSDTSIDRARYAFRYWAENRDDTGGRYSGGNTITVTGNTTLYAQWQYVPQNIGIVYCPNSSSVDANEVDRDITEGTSYTVRMYTTFHPPYNKHFVNWNTKPDGSGTTYEVGKVITAPSDDLHLYAQWADDPKWSELGIAISAPKKALPGADLTYGITVTNGTGYDLNSVVVDVALPAEVTYDASLSSSGAWGFSYDSGTHTVTARLESADDSPVLALNGTSDFSLPVTINPAVFGTIEAKATIAGASSRTGGKTGEGSSAAAQTTMAGLDISVTAAPTDPTLGETITYTVTVTNNTGHTLSGIRVNNGMNSYDSISMLSLQSSLSDGWDLTSTSEGNLCYFYRDLAPGDSSSYKLTTSFINADNKTAVCTATITSLSAGGSTVSGDFGSASAAAALKELDWSKLKIEKTVDKTSARPGDTLTYTIKVTNTTGYDLTDLRVEDPVPANTSNPEASQSSGRWFLSVPTDNSRVVAELQGGLAKGASETFFMEVTVDRDVPSGKVESTAKIAKAKSGSDYDLTDTHPGGIVSNTVTTDVLPALELSMSVSPAMPTIYQTFTYTVTVKNNSNINMKAVYIHDVLPKDVSIGGKQVFGGGAGSMVKSDDIRKPTVLDVTITELAAGGEAYYIVNAYFTSNIPTAENVASITKFITEDNKTVTEGLDTAKATAYSLLGLSIKKSVDKDTAKPGDTLIYTVEVNNGTITDLTKLSVDDILPAGVTYDPANSVPGDWTFDTATTPGTVKASLSTDLISGGKAVFKIAATVNAGVSGTITNEAKITEAESKYGSMSSSTNKYDTARTEVLSAVPVNVTVLFTGLKDVSQVPAGYKLTGADGNPFLKGEIKLDPAESKTGHVFRKFSTEEYVRLGQEYSLSFTQSDYDIPGYICTLTTETDPIKVTAQDAIAGINAEITLSYVKENLYTYPSLTVRTYFKGLAKLPDSFGYKLNCVSAPEDAIAFQGPLALTPGTENGVPYLEFSAKNVTLQAGTELTFSFTQSGYDVPGYLCALGSSTFKFTLPVPTTDVRQPILLKIENTYTQPDWSKLTITKTADKTSATPGSVVNYTVTVTNNTGADLSNIIVADKLDSRLRYSDSTGDYDTGTGTWTVASLANGKSVTLTLTVKLKYALAAGTVIENTASVTEAAAAGLIYDLSGQKLNDSVSVTVTSGKGSPRTGDESNLGLWIAVMAASLACAGAAAVIYKKRRG